MKARHLLAALLFAAALPAQAATVPAAQVTDVIEFYNQTLDHYFITTDPNEAADLDNGVHVGWKRTGLTFQAIKAGQVVAGSVPICRFYGSPKSGLDSHFYSASVSECAEVQAKFPDAWLLESPEVFRAFPVDPNTGNCPSSNEPIFRLWNKRSDVNHRYTDQTTIYQQMVAKGYVAEGNGNPTLPVIFCMPMKDQSIGAPPGTPACTLSASSANPLLGAPITLTANCTNNPTSFAWTNCVSTGSTCIANASVAGTVTYSVVGSNGSGAGNKASADVNWTSSGGPVPICTISASSGNPLAGSGVTLTANCSQSPSSYGWLTCNYLIQGACNFIANCPSGSNTCTTNQSVAGAAHYAVEATNSAGKSARAGIDIDWGGNGGGGGGGGGNPTAPVCNLFTSNSTPQINTSIVLSASCSGNPTSYVWTNCTSTGASCSATASNAGTVIYQVVASNSAGNSAPATVQVQWQNPAPPSCSLSASNLTPMAGTTITLTANCTGSPTNYVWTGCTSNSSTCQATNANTGAVVYSVAAVNASGSGAPASVTVNWQPRPTAPPACSVTSSNPLPFTGQTITLTATCTNSPLSYSWTNCLSTTSTCQVTSSTAGSQTYTVSATNVIGTGAPASVTVNWQQSTTPPDFCGQYSDVVRVGEPWGGSPLLPADYGGSFRASMVLVVAITTPGTPSYGSPAFASSVAEYQGPPTFRHVTLSRSPCDFRAYDPSGQAGPFSIGYGNTATVTALVGSGLAMAPNQTYYLNVRNWSPDIGATCKTGACNAIVGGFVWPH